MFFKFQTYLLFSFFLLSLHSCGGGGGGKGEAVQISPIVEENLNSYPPDLLSYSACFDEQTTQFLNSFQSLWRVQGRPTEAKVSLSNFPNTPGLSNLSNTNTPPSLFRKVYTNGIFVAEIKAVVTYDSSNESITLKESELVKNSQYSMLFDTYQIRKIPTPLTLCENEEYSNRSVEKEAISLLPPLEAAYQFTKDALGITPIPLTLYLNSDFGQEIHINLKNQYSNRIERKINRRIHDTSNAYWNRTDDSRSHSIIVLANPLVSPDDYYYSDYQKVPKLWTLPFVITHEYGHHILTDLIFKSMPKSLRLSLMNKNHSYSSCHDPSLFQRKISLKSGQKKLDEKQTKEVFTRLIFSAFEEGFADLFAHLVHAGKYSDLSYEPCFLTQSRTITSPQFADGQWKLFSSTSLNQFVAPQTTQKGMEKNGSPCDRNTRYSDPHQFGAIIAYMTNQLFTSGTIDSVNGLKFLYDFSTKIPKLVQDSIYTSAQNVSYLDRETPKVYSKATKLILLEYLKNFQQYFVKPLNTDQCNLLNSLFKQADDLASIKLNLCTNVNKED
ncbi:MAG: hypothetical protein QE271_03740 [Bacteriovoracaceae bacterium]|nr:hypothetical protein [Bacteriovoracaceae bacterium]